MHLEFLTEMTGEGGGMNLGAIAPSYSHLFSPIFTYSHLFSPIFTILTYSHLLSLILTYSHLPLILTYLPTYFLPTYSH